MSKFVIIHNSEEDTFDEEAFMAFFESNQTRMFSIKVDDNNIVVSDEHLGDGEEEHYAPYSDLLRYNIMGAMCRYMKAHKG